MVILALFKTLKRNAQKTAQKKNLCACLKSQFCTHPKSLGSEEIKKRAEQSCSDQCNNKQG